MTKRKVTSPSSHAEQAKGNVWNVVRGPPPLYPCAPKRQKHTAATVTTKRSIGVYRCLWMAFKNASRSNGGNWRREAQLKHAAVMPEHWKQHRCRASLGGVALMHEITRLTLSSFCSSVQACDVCPVLCAATVECAMSTCTSKVFRGQFVSVQNRDMAELRFCGFEILVLRLVVEQIDVATRVPEIQQTHVRKEIREPFSTLAHKAVAVYSHGAATPATPPKPQCRSSTLSRPSATSWLQLTQPAWSTKMPTRRQAWRHCRRQHASVGRRAYKDMLLETRLTRPCSDHPCHELCILPFPADSTLLSDRITASNEHFLRHV